ncbi:peptidoglycan-N-acetylglucosamine deacetylase [Streptomyces acidiscabies]|nr:polysaccharide deacetylase family protein [Streptomyces acidiscabies]GAV39348.1 peptidoglycan-N-acetylglucosamine deacetylase [Streptomyces acidiscabies]
MITPVRALATACVLAAALTACGTTKTTPPSSAPERAPSSAPPSPAAAPSLSPPPTLAAAPSGLTPVFEHAPRKARTVALTFDADMTSDQGPRAARGEHFDNPALIATLRSLKIPATVFMTGRWAEEYPDQARSIGRDPLFEVANHSYSHHAFTADCYGLPTVPEADMQGDVEKAYAAFRKAGVPHAMPYFRFPGGCYDKTALRALNATGVTAVQWDVISGDAFATDADAVARQVLDGVKPGSVVVMHCTRSAAPTTERALRTIVPELRRKGYRFVKVSDQIRAAVG